MIPVADYFGIQDLINQLESLKDPVEKRDDENIITLDLGGTIFKTTRATLTRRYKNSHFAQMFLPGSKTAPPVTKDGAYFIDSDPDVLALILKMLRDRWCTQRYDKCNKGVADFIAVFGVALPIQYKNKV